MIPINMKQAMKLAGTAVLGLAAMLSSNANAAVPGISGASSGTTPVFNIQASANYISQPDGAAIYSWGYGCNGAPVGYLPANVPGKCTDMQLPGPTLIVNEGDTVTVNLTNNLPAAAGNTSITFPGFAVTTVKATTPDPLTDGVPGILAQEAMHGGSVTYTFTATNPGTYAYHSGTQADLQVEMGLYGAIIVVPKQGNGYFSHNNPSDPCKVGPYSLSAYAYDQPQTCYDREYLFQFSEISLKVHQQVEALVNSGATSIAVAIDPYVPEYFLLNGRAFPDDIDGVYAPNYPRQPYNASPQILPGEYMLMRIVGHSREPHPFHFHGNHAREIARDGNIIVSKTDANKLAGPLHFSIVSEPGQTTDLLFTWTGQGLNWDIYGTTDGHTCNGLATPSAGFDSVTHEYCPDHGKPIPVTLPDPKLVAIGQFYSGTPYLGLTAAPTTPLPPGFVPQNTVGGYAYMWHSHAEREITTNNVFPGGMATMMIVNPPGTSINEAQ